MEKIFNQRAIEISLAHGVVSTPCFMPVGTLGTVKSVGPDALKEVGAQILLSNTYHLFLRPGLEVLKRFGGLHAFVGWEGPILTDSGGFQVFSLDSLKKITEEGVEFRSHLNGEKIFLTPENCAEIQQVICSDIAMVLDECISLPASEEKTRAALERTLRWTERFLKVPRREGQKIFGIVQGGESEPLRLESLQRTLEFPVDGIALGGFSVGEPHETMVRLLQFLAPHLPERPRYLMGVGTPLDLLEAVRNGIDLFDCVLPSRNGRNGGFFTDEGLLNIRNQKFQLDSEPIDPGCRCPTCQSFSRAYLRHLFQTKEILGAHLATLHNLYYYFTFMSEMREQILKGTFQEYYGRKLPQLSEAYGRERKL